MGERVNISVLARNRFDEDQTRRPSISLDYKNVTKKQTSVMLVIMKKRKRSNPIRKSKKNISDEKKLRHSIDELKEQLHKLVRIKGLSDHAVIALSQELDKYILEYQLIMRNGS